MKLIEFSYDRRYIGLLETDNDSQIHLIETEYLYELILFCLNNRIPFIDYLKTRAKKKWPFKALTHSVRFHVPLNPNNPLLSFVSGVGLTHRRRLHAKKKKIYQPEWFYKGNGTILKSTNTVLEIPDFSRSASEEAELVMIYVVDNKQVPHCIGYALGNEFSDPKLAKENHLYFSQAKLRNCAVGPELIVGAPPANVSLTITIHRQNKILWQDKTDTGTKNMFFSIEQIENLLFRHQQFLHPGMVHYLFLGADKTSYSSDIPLQAGDSVSISSELFTFNLVSPIVTASYPSGMKSSILI